MASPVALATKTRRFGQWFTKSHEQRNARLNYAFKKSIRNQSASIPLQAYVLIRFSLKTRNFVIFLLLKNSQQCAEEVPPMCANTESLYRLFHFSETLIN
jgi:hypothetical protein